MTCCCSFLGFQAASPHHDDGHCRRSYSQDHRPCNEARRLVRFCRETDWNLVGVGLGHIHSGDSLITRETYIYKYNINIYIYIYI